MSDSISHGFFWLGEVAGWLGPFVCYFLIFVFVTALEGLTDLYWSIREPDE